MTNPQGEALEDALDRCSLTCINDGSTTRTATRPGDSDSVIDLAISTLRIAQYCKWQTLGPHGNDHFPCTIYVRKSKLNQKVKRKRAFQYECKEDNPVDNLRKKKQGKPVTLTKERRDQPPWFTTEIEELWRTKKKACKLAQRYRENLQLKEEARQASSEFEEAANKAKELKYEEFSQSVSQDRTLYKFWRFYGAMNNSKKANDVPDFRNEEDVWMRTPEEKGKAFLERYLKQTDQKNEQARRDLMSRMETYFEDQNVPS